MSEPLPKIVEDVLTRLAPALAPGGADELRGLYRRNPDRPRDHRAGAGEVLDYVLSERGRHLLKPGYQPPAGTDLRRALEFLPLKPGAAEQLADAWQVELLAPLQAQDGSITRPTPGQLAARALAKLDQREHWGHLAEAPEVPSHERRVAEVLGEFRREHILRHDVDVAELAHEWSDLGFHYSSRARLTQGIAKRLTTPHGKPHLRDPSWEFDWGHARFRDEPLTEERREQIAENVGLPGL